MQLSLHSDYSLRVLIYLGTHPDRVVSTQEISTAYSISRHHLVRVVQTLAEHGYVRATAGRAGGVRLAQPPREVRLGDVFQDTEPNLRLVECFEMETNTCPISPACELKRVLREALSAFLDTLNRYTLETLLGDGAQARLSSLFVQIAAAIPAAPAGVLKCENRPS